MIDFVPSITGTIMFRSFVFVSPVLHVCLTGDRPVCDPPPVRVIFHSYSSFVAGVFQRRFVVCSLGHVYLLICDDIVPLDVLMPAIIYLTEVVSLPNPKSIIIIENNVGTASELLQSRQHQQLH